MLKEKIYTSTAIIPDTSQILSEAIQRNRQHNVTGILIYNGKHFMQLLEGPEQEVEYIYQKIIRDPRHDNLELWSDILVPERSFEEHPMKYCDHLVGEFELPRNITDTDIKRMMLRVEMMRCHADWYSYA